MSRATVTVKSVFWDLCRAIGQEPDPAINSAGIPAILKAQLLRAMNTAHEECYTANEWEDAWEDGTLTVTSNVIPYADIDDATRFTLWSSDPRVPNSSAYPIPFTTSADGIVVQYPGTSSVFAFWLPAIAAFTDAESTTDTILACIAPAVVDMARAEHLTTSGQHQTAMALDQRARTRLEDRWAVEFQRVARKIWLRPTY